MTKKQGIRLAREARRLAMECLEGTAPEFRPHSYCGCAIGEIMARTGRRPSDSLADIEAASAIDEFLPDKPYLFAPGVVSNALMEAVHFGTTPMEAVVFPLMALADALEDASKTPKKDL